MNRFGALFFLFGVFSFPAFSQPVPLTENGSIPIWSVAGPLPYYVQDTAGQRRRGFYYDFLAACGGERQAVPANGDPIEINANKSVAWKTALTDSSAVLNFIDLFQTDTQSRGVAYAFCRIHSDRPQDVALQVRSNDGVRVWLNQDLVHDNDAARTLNAIPDQVPVTLKKGINRLLAKVNQFGGGWALSIAVTGRHNEPVKGITASVSSSTPVIDNLLSAKFTATPLVVKTPTRDRQILRAEIQSGGLKDVTCRISSDAWPTPERFRLGDIPLGTQIFAFKLPVLSQDCKINVTLRSSSGEKRWSDIPFQKPRQWTIYLVQHVHTDIGYTRPQTEILPEHLRYIDYALDYCDLTDDYPDDAQFRWTCEISWAVREYLKRRSPAQIARLEKRVDQGRIEIAGMFLNMSDMATESALAASLQPLRRFKEKYGFPIRTAMQNDVNGAAWCLVDYFSDIGIRYLTMGINNTRSLLPFDKPTPFWWESPSGKRILAYRADHYHTGNKWKIHEGKLGPFKEHLLTYLRSLEKKQYPFDRIAVQYSGYLTDNSPPATIECDLIRKWNETYKWPRLRSATAHEFLEYIEKNYRDSLSVHRQAWPDWWTDGFGSAARETAAARHTHMAMQVTDTLFAMARLLGAHVPPDALRRATAVQEDLLFYDEHTYGAAESISDPMSENSMVQWAEKSSYAWDAVKKAALLREESLGLLQDFIPRSDMPTIAVFNTLNWKRSGLLETFIYHEIIPPNTPSRIIDPETGDVVPAQRLRSRAEGSYWAIWVSDVPPLGCKALRIEKSGPQPRPAPASDTPPTTLENRFYRISLNPETAAITSLFDKEMNREWVDRNCKWNLGQLIYEQLSGGRDFNTGAFHRSTVNGVSIQRGADGPIWKSVRFNGRMKGCDSVWGEIRLYKTTKRVDFLYSIRKQAIRDPEAVYVAFPFNSPGATLLYEAQGGLVIPGKDQIPRSSSDWQGIQSFASVQSPNGQIIIGSDEIPLVQFGDINLGKWQELPQVNHPYIYSWVLNNYWFTNFRATQEGEIKWSYYLMSTPKPSRSAAVQSGWGARIPLVGRVLPSGTKKTNNGPASFSLPTLSVSHVLLVDAKPAEYSDGVILHFRELDGKTVTYPLKNTWLSGKVRRVDEVNVLEEPLNKGMYTLTFTPFESKFIRIISR